MSTHVILIGVKRVWAMRLIGLYWIGPLLLLGGILSTLLLDAPETYSEIPPHKLEVTDDERLVGEFKKLQVNPEQARVVRKFCEVPGVEWAALRGLRGEDYEAVIDCGDAPVVGFELSGKLLVECEDREGYYACPIASSAISVVEVQHEGADRDELRALVKELEAAYAISKKRATDVLIGPAFLRETATFKTFQGKHFS